MTDEGETPDYLEGNIEFNDVIFHYPARPTVQVGSVSMATLSQSVCLHLNILFCVHVHFKLLTYLLVLL